MNFSSIGNSIITVLTGTDPATLQADVTAAEQSVITAVEAVIVLLAIIVIELFILIRKK